MSTRKSMTLPIVITFLVILVMVYLFANIKQTQVTCEKKYTFDSDVRLSEEVVATLDGKKITDLSVTKVFVFSEKYANDEYLSQIHDKLNTTLEYLGNKVRYTISDNRIIVSIHVDKNEIVLLDNIDFVRDGELKILINSNTKSNSLIPLTVGDTYTDGEFMKYFKNNGYSCN